MALDHEQEEARTITGTSVIVSASAGAGKTSVLVQRLLKRCVDDRIELDRILAMTFTKAAAEEMKKRLAAGLSERHAAAESEEERSYIAGQLVKLADASITTIDSYCLSIIQKYCSVIGLDPASCRNILDDGTAGKLKKEAFRQAMSSLIRRDPDRAMRLASFFSARCEDYDGLEQALFSIITHALSSYDPDAFYQRARDMYHTGRGLKDFAPEILDAYFDSLLVQLENMLETLERMRQAAMENEESKVDLSTLDVKKAQLMNCVQAVRDRSISAYQTALEAAVLTDPTADTKDERYSAQRKEFTAGMRAMLAESFDESVLAEDARETEPFVNDLIDLAIDVENCFREEKKKNVCMDFTDMERYALDILNASDGAVAEMIRSSLDEIMVDEFQDTSSLQNAIIKKIARPDNVFRVGDVKQSIYRFRQAQPSLMRGLLRDPSQHRITLRHNYRSRRSIVEFNNLLFGQLMNIPGFSDTYTEEDSVTIGRSGQDEDPVPVVFALVEKDEAHSALSEKECRARWIAEEMLRMHREEGRQFRDFCVLVRSHKNKLVLRSAFEKYGIPYEIDTREGFFNSALCLEMQEMAEYMLDPSSSAALASVLTGAFCRYTDEDLAAMKKGFPSLTAGADHQHPEIRAEFEELAAIADSRGILELLKEIACRHDFYNSLSVHDQANFDFLLQKTAASGVTDLYSFLQMMKNGSEENSSEASSRSLDDNTVTVTTIHQSKGLQYPVVFLWSDSKNSFREKSERITIHDSLMLGVPFFDPETRLTRSTVQSKAVRHALDMEDQQEFIRLLYVALTRAEERMFIVDSLSDKPMPSSVTRSLSSARRGMTSLILAARAKNPLLEVRKVMLADLSAAPAPARRSSEELPAAGISADLLPPVVTPSSTEFTELPPLPAHTENAGRNYGTDIHACLASLPDRVWTADDFSGFSIGENDVRRMIEFSETPLYQECLAMKIYKEEPFFVIDRDENRTITGSFDLIAVSASEVILIDFKTDHADLSSIQSRYASQIETYRKALQILYSGRKIRAFAYSFHNSAFITF